MGCSWPIQVVTPTLSYWPTMKSLFSGSKGKRKRTTISKRYIPEAGLHRLRRERNCIKENCLWLEVRILRTNSAGPSRCNQYSMSTVFPHISVSIHYKSVAWNALIRTVEWLSIVGKGFGTYRHAFNSVASTGPCLLVFKQFPVKGKFCTQPIGDGGVSLFTAARAPLFLTTESWDCDHNTPCHWGRAATDQRRHRGSCGDCTGQGHPGTRCAEGALQPHLCPSARTAHAAIGLCKPHIQSGLREAAEANMGLKAVL